jgi:hypothetical protein
MHRRRREDLVLPVTAETVPEALTLPGLMLVVEFT